MRLLEVVRVTGLEPVRKKHTPLKRACLPVPAHSLGADDGVRTRYLHLGKVALCQMSYIRMVPSGGIEPPTQGFSVLCSTD